MSDSRVSRRGFLQVSALGVSLPAVLAMRDLGQASQTTPRVRSCVFLYCWGGMSHLETWDPKPEAPVEYRGEFRPIATNVPGIRFGEHMPLIAAHADKLAVIRSMHHRCTAHGQGMYWNWTGFPPPIEAPMNLPPTRHDRPSLGPIISKFRPGPADFPSAVQLPYPMIDNSTFQAGENAGFLGQAFDQVIIRTSRGRPYGGVSRDLGAMVLNPTDGIDRQRFEARRGLVVDVNRGQPAAAPIRAFERFREMATGMLTSPRVQAAFDLDREPLAVRQSYGEHICGQSLLQARRLVEAGVPAITVLCSAGDLNGSAGDHWDTHGDNFNRLKRDLLPPFDRGASALLADLQDRGLLGETLVVIFTEFGRTPRINGNGRDHYPGVYSIAFAGGGVRGGQTYGRSDRIGAHPHENATTPADLHACVYHALGIPLDATIADAAGQRFPLCVGNVLPIFG